MMVRAFYSIETSCTTTLILPVCSTPKRVQKENQKSNFWPTHWPGALVFGWEDEGVAQVCTPDQVNIVVGGAVGIWHHRQRLERFGGG